VAIALAVTVVIVLVLPVWAWLAPPVKFARCVFNGQPHKNVSSPAASVNPAKLALVGGQLTAIEFSRSITTKTLTMEYQIKGQLPQIGLDPRLTVEHQDFLRSDQAMLVNSRVRVAAWFQHGRVLLEVCVNRTGPDLGDPGVYQGIVSIVDPRVARVDVPITVDLSYPYWQWVLELLVLAVMAGTWYFWVLQRKNPEDFAIGTAFVNWCGTAIGVITIAVGVIAALGVYNATYLNNDSWGSSAEQPLSLLGAMFSAVLATAATVHIGSKAGRTPAAPGGQGAGAPGGPPPGGAGG
jgi:hypothetical protein